MTSISTKTGDAGQSSLANGQRVNKSDLIFEVLGDLDELNSYLGLAACYGVQLEQIQKNLYLISAVIAKSPKAKFENKNLKNLEKLSAKLQASMSKNWHNKFLLPGGSKVGAYLDIARAICRRAERHAWALNKKNKINNLILKYLNRLSDYLYLLRCQINQDSGVEESVLEFSN